MRIGVPRETKDREFRVGMTPDGARALVLEGHEVWIERGAGLGSGFANEDYEDAGARLAATSEVWEGPDLIVKVKEPNKTEVELLRREQVLFTYLHLAAACLHRTLPSS